MSKLRRKTGLTMAEMLIAVLIMAMVTGVAVGGIPAAINAYTRVVDTANAQVLLSTTLTKLREELGTAAEIKVPELTKHDNDSWEATMAGDTKAITRTPASGTDGGMVTYENDEIKIIFKEKEGKLVPQSVVYKNGTVAFESEDGSESWIFRKSTGEPGIYIREYADLDNTGKYEHLLVSKSASNKNLYVTYGAMSMDFTTGMFSVKSIRVLNTDGQELANLQYVAEPGESEPDNPDGELKIRILHVMY